VKNAREASCSLWSNVGPGAGCGETAGDQRRRLRRNARATNRSVKRRSRNRSLVASGRRERRGNGKIREAMGNERALLQRFGGGRERVGEGESTAKRNPLCSRGYFSWDLPFRRSASRFAPLFFVRRNVLRARFRTRRGRRFKLPAEIISVERARGLVVRSCSALSLGYIVFCTSAPHERGIFFEPKASRSIVSFPLSLSFSLVARALLRVFYNASNAREYRARACARGVICRSEMPG